MCIETGIEIVVDNIFRSGTAFAITPYFASKFEKNKISR